ncbi:hypothetical protein GPECTOR_36g114 [Gonium pectorale]|uniref:Uncharacterized protein n=1 Tax=Gonium pectorale TaxID=33097 RepID=A0A150GBN5_GONPE|nr:hypothetical protein GPECTOR_36g114 [Gonium pectorale]|eukprot:KXZ47261.1 hypothetical protein GPECTOR_36g114 [Gonium pectorale]
MKPVVLVLNAALSWRNALAAGRPRGHSFAGWVAAPVRRLHAGAPGPSPPQPGPSGRTAGGVAASNGRRPKSESHTADHEYPGPHHPTHRFGPLAEPHDAPAPPLLPGRHHKHIKPGTVPPAPLSPPPRDMTPELLSAASPAFRTRAFSTAPGSRGEQPDLSATFPSPDNNYVPDDAPGAEAGAGSSSGTVPGASAGGGRAAELGQHDAVGRASFNRSDLDQDPDSPQVMGEEGMPPGARISSGPEAAQGVGAEDLEAGASEGVPPLAS